METNQAVLNQTAVFLMASDSALRDLAESMSDAEDAVGRAQGLNLKSGTTLQHLQVTQLSLVVSYISDLQKEHFVVPY